MAMPIVLGMATTLGFAQQQPGEGVPAAGPTCNGTCCCAGNSQAPVGVMTDHIHAKGSWMVTYTFSNTMMQGNNMGATKISDNTLYKNYMMAPETMSMNMHMVMAMYGVTDKLTLMAMGGYMNNSMSMNMSNAAMTMPGMVMPSDNNMAMTSMSSGITDTKISALYNFSDKASQRIIGSLGLNLPTGSITATGTTMLGANQRLPYDMQIGTGSYAIDPDFTYAHKHNSFYWGANAGADIKLNYNSLGYRDGNNYHVTAWAGYQFLPWLSGTLRAADIYTNKISGYDKEMNISIYQESDPTTPTANYGGTCISMYAGLNFYLMKPVLNHFRLMVEYGMPVYQNLNGTQMATRSNLQAGLQFSF